MRFFDFSATALVASAAVLQGASAAVTPDSYGQAAAPAPPSYNNGLTSATTTYTTTRTVLRVVETLTATRNGTTSALTTTSSSTETATVPKMTAFSTGTISYPKNATSSVVFGTGALPSVGPSATYVPPQQQTTSGAGKLGVEALGMAALAGIIGLALF